MIAVADILQCPRCGSDIVEGRCAGTACIYSEGFPKIADQLVLIDFERSIFNLEDYVSGDSAVVRQRSVRKSIGARIDSFTAGSNAVAAIAAQAVLDRLKIHRHRPQVLVVGGGTIGRGAEKLYESSDIDLVGTDVYASDCTQLVADGHSLPFKDRSFDAVWIQAVLEHVLDPWKVAGEIYRVLRPAGVVYADTPFMQQVHEGAYDFTRFSVSGHRWLFRNFAEIASGPVAGAGTVLIWSIRRLLKSVGLPDKLCAAAGHLVFPLRYLDKLGNRRTQCDNASGVYFFGIKADDSFSEKAMPGFYNAQQEASPFERYFQNRNPSPRHGLTGGPPPPPPAPPPPPDALPEVSAMSAASATPAGSSTAQ